MKYVLLLGCVLLLSACLGVKREEKEQVSSNKEEITKKEEIYDINISIPMFDGTVIPILGSVTKTTFEEKVTKEEANKDRVVKTGVDEERLVAAISKVVSGYAKGGLGGGLLGLIKTPEGVTAGGGLLAALGLAFMKHMQAKRSDAQREAEIDRRKRAEANEDEVYNDLKAHKATNHERKQDPT